jgi:hypothetical protein
MCVYVFLHGVLSRLEEQARGFFSVLGVENSRMFVQSVSMLVN